jgi:hypothetical protein
MEFCICFGRGALPRANGDERYGLDGRRRDEARYDGAGCSSARAAGEPQGLRQQLVDRQGVGWEARPSVGERTTPTLGTWPLRSAHAGHAGLPWMSRSRPGRRVEARATPG